MRAPLALTQAGIAAATGIHHRNVSRYLLALLKAGAVAEHSGHVAGTPRRVKFYRLTPAGLRRAGALQTSLSSARIEWSGGTVTVAEAARRMGGVGALEALKRIASGEARTPGPAATLVGRSVEMRRLLAALEDAARGRGAFVLVAGEAGIGKTRLAKEAIAEARNRGITVLEGRCTQAGGEPLAPLEEACRGLPAESGGPLEPGGVSLLAMLPPDEGEGGPAGSFRRRIDAAAARGPLLLFVDDLQWADPSTCAQLIPLGRATASSPLIIFATARDDELGRSPGGELVRRLVREGLVDELALGPLPRRETELLARRLTAGARMEKETLARIVARSDGNPLFVESIVEEIGREGSVAVPKRLRSVLDSRMEMLDPPARESLAIAAVIGERFDLEILARAAASLATGRPDPAEDLVDAGRASAARAMEKSRALGLVIESAPPSSIAGYAFRHALFREAVIGSMGDTYRRGVHAAVARALETRVRGGTGFFEVAHHLSRASSPEAGAWAARAGEVALSQGLPSDAERVAQEALDSKGAIPAPDRARLHAILGESRLVRGEIPGAARALQASLELADSARARRTLAVLRARSGRLEEAQMDAQAALDTAVASGEKREMVACNVVLARVRAAAADIRASRESARRAVEAAEDLGDPSLLAQSLIMLGAQTVQSGDIAAADLILDRAGTLIDARDRLGRAALDIQRGFVRINGGDLTVGERLIASAVAIFESAGAHGMLPSALRNLGMVTTFRGGHAKGLEYTRRAFTAAVRAGDVVEMHRCRAALGAALVHDGRLKEARKVLDQDRPAWLPLNETWSYVDLYLGLIAMAEDRRDEARRLFAASESRGERAGVGGMHWAAMLGRARLEIRDGRAPAAERYAEKMAPLAASRGRKDELAEVALIKAGSARLRGRREEAGAHLAEAKTLFTGLEIDNGMPEFEEALQAKAAGDASRARRLAAEARRRYKREGLWWELKWLEEEFGRK
jgi:tetratricopeptide (TPR) repeat protein